MVSLVDSSIDRLLSTASRKSKTTKTKRSTPLVDTGNKINEMSYVISDDEEGIFASDDNIEEDEDEYEDEYGDENAKPKPKGKPKPTKATKTKAKTTTVKKSSAKSTRSPSPNVFEEPKPTAKSGNKSASEQYQKLTPLQHILQRPDTVCYFQFHCIIYL